ncbi:hypothetical protein BDQ12DRAFT_577072, partial [Crucibulum laeve]
TSSKRSPSPIISFAVEGTQVQVQNITRKVIRRLEGMGGHLEREMGEVEEELEVGDEEESVDGSTVDEGSVRGLNGKVNGLNGHAHTNGNGKSLSKRETSPGHVQKVDWEIPRKLLHSSIGFITLYLYLTPSSVPRITTTLWSALCVIVPADILRFRSRRFAQTYERFWGFLMRESERNSVNGVVWYILGVNFALTAYPHDIATVAILILSWADTAASTIGRYFGAASPRLPARTPVLRLPLSPRKSRAGFIAASITGAVIAVGFWGWLAPLRVWGPGEGASWVWGRGVTLDGLRGVGDVAAATTKDAGWLAGWLGLGAIGVVAGLVSGVAEALDLGNLDDNLTLPIISGGCILGFMKLLSLFGS